MSTVETAVGPEVRARFWEKVRADGTGCWIWIGASRADRYGSFRFEGSSQQAHRVAYRMQIGTIPEGLVLDHLCRVRGCVNPKHLEPVTEAENIARGELWAVNGKKTHCPQGHAYTPVNTRWDGNGKRYCRLCERERSARRWQEKLRQREAAS